MSIETIGSMNTILTKFDAKDWTNSADISVQKPFKLDDAPGIDFTDTKKSFSEMLASSIGEVNNMQQEANKAMQKLMSGENKNIAETMVLAEKADIAFRTMNQVRRKVIDAYKEIMRMQL